MNKTFLFAIVILVMHACKQPGEQVRTDDATVSVAYIHPR